MSRVDRFLPMLQVEVCFLRFLPGFPAVPQYFNHTSVGPNPFPPPVLPGLIGNMGWSDYLCSVLWPRLLGFTYPHCCRKA